jgi:hypothetical protein
MMMMQVLTVFSASGSQTFNRMSTTGTTLPGG